MYYKGHPRSLKDSRSYTYIDWIRTGVSMASWWFCLWCKTGLAWYTPVLGLVMQSDGRLWNLYLWVGLIDRLDFTRIDTLLFNKKLPTTFLWFKWIKLTTRQSVSACHSQVKGRKSILRCEFKNVSALKCSS